MSDVTIGGPDSGKGIGSEPAYPAMVDVEYSKTHIMTEQTPGLTKREYFAGLAMQGIVSQDADFIKATYDKGYSIASMAVEQADALIKELSKYE